MEAIYSLFRGIRTLIWFPFSITANPAFIVVVCVGSYLYQPETAFLAIFGAVVVCGMSMPIEVTLRPTHRAKLIHPAREKAVRPSRARIVVRGKGRAASLRRISRAIGPELCALVADRSMPEPAAVLHQNRRLAAQQAAKKDAA